MTPLIVDGLLVLAIASVWLGCFGFVGLKTALDRLHCATFINVAAGLCVVLAAVVQDGATSRSWKSSALLVGVLLVGAASTHAVARALYLRDSEER